MAALYFLFGQIGWFACVLSAAHHVPLIGTAVAVLLISAHLCRVPRPMAELKLIMATTLLGAVWESTLVQLRWLEYGPEGLIAGLVPYWLAALWALFAAQMNTTYGWLKTRLPVAALLGAVAGPLSFHAGAMLHSLVFAKPRTANLALVLGWAVLLPVIAAFSRHWDGVRDRASPRCSVHSAPRTPA